MTTKYRTSTFILFKIYARFLSSWQWEWMATLTFPDDRHFGPNLTKSILLGWTRKLCTREHIQVGYYYVLCWNYGHPHLHLLMIGRGGEEKSLKDVSRNIWAKQWPYFAKIELPKSNLQVSKYLATHKFRKKCYRAEFDCYNIKLLKKYKLFPSRDI